MHEEEPGSVEEFEWRGEAAIGQGTAGQLGAAEEVSGGADPGGGGVSVGEVGVAVVGGVRVKVCGLVSSSAHGWKECTIWPPARSGRGKFGHQPGVASQEWERGVGEEGGRGVGERMILLSISKLTYFL